MSKTDKKKKEELKMKIVVTAYESENKDKNTKDTHTKPEQKVQAETHIDARGELHDTIIKNKSLNK